MKRIDADSFLKEIKNISVEKPHKFLLYAIQKTTENLENLSNEIIEESKKLYTQEFFDLENARRELVKEYSEKDADGNFVVNGEYIKIDENKKEEFSDKLKEYQETNKELIEKYNKIVEELDAFLGEEIGEDFIVKVSIKNFPEYPGEDTFKVLSKLIKESQKEVIGLTE